MHPRIAHQPAPDPEDVAPPPAPERAPRRRPPRLTSAEQDKRPMTRRQRTICRAYFANGCLTKRTADALGLSAARIREVKARPPAVAYLNALEAEACEALTTAQAARILAPMLS